MRLGLVGGAALVAVVGIWACGGGGGGDRSAGPTAPSAGGSAGTTVGIVGNRGAQSFNPNPSEAGQGSTIAWRNDDGTTHRIVFNDGSLDTGNIAPGTSSPAMRVGTDGANYHCTIHPTMVGSIRASSGSPPTCQGIYCE